jgi:transcription termination factor NusB
MESKIIKTPKLVIINEVVELCKLFGNDQAAKLVNGIIHKILSE